MQYPLVRFPSRRLGQVAVALVALGVAILLRGPLLRVVALVLGAGALCFVASPLARRLEGRLSKSAAVLLALAALALGVAGILALLLPRMLAELMELAGALPATLRQLSGLVEQGRTWLNARLPGVTLPALNLSALEGVLTGLAGGTVSFVVNLADVVGQFSMMAVLAYFFLMDRDKLLLRLELLLPQSKRHMAVRMGNAVCRELRLYLRAQLMIALAVGAVATLALTLIGVRSALALGPIIGLLNMIPYFGPFIGGVPAVLIALGDGWQKALMTLIAILAVQQLDGSWISPRIMGSLTGFSPALVLVGFYAGASLCGVPGMLLALPAMLAIRTLFRVFVQKCENI